MLPDLMLQGTFHGQPMRNTNKQKSQSLFCMFLKAQMPNYHLLNGLLSHGGREKYSPAALNWVLAVPNLIHTYIHMYIHMYVHTYICTYIHTHTYISHQTCQGECYDSQNKRAQGEEQCPSNQTARRKIIILYKRPSRDYSKMKVKWSYELNKDLYNCYLESDHKTHGYMKRLKSLWDEKELNIIN